MSQYLLLLAIIPLSTYFLSKMYKPKHKWLFTGIAFGMVVAPVSLSLLKFAFVPVIGKLLGFIGLIFNLIHGSIGYFMVTGLGFEGAGSMLTASEVATINVVNGVIWSLHYGIVGYNIDVKWASVPTTQKAYMGADNHKPVI